MSRTIEATTDGKMSSVKASLCASGRVYLRIAIEQGMLGVFLTPEEALELADAIELAVAEGREKVAA